MSTKHECGQTLGQFPHLYPYVMEHINDTDADKALRAKIEKSTRAGMMGAPDEAAFLAWLCGLIGAKKVIEVGVFRGSTTLALARAIPSDGKVVGLDVSAEYTADGMQAWVEAGVASKIDLRIAPATESLRKMVETDGEQGTYDLAFIDADKEPYDEYYEQCLKLLRVGGIVAVDNVLWHGAVLTDEDPASTAIRNLNKKISMDPRVHATLLPIADGVYMCRKL